LPHSLKELLKKIEKIRKGKIDRKKAAAKSRLARDAVFRPYASFISSIL
jgi:hypothetical protein